MNILLKAGIALAMITGMSTAGMAAYSQSQLAPLTKNEIRDVVELLKFVQTAKPKVFEKFAVSFVEIAQSCAQSNYQADYAGKLIEMIAGIERELPPTSQGILSKINLAVVFGGRNIYRPTFFDRANIRESISKFMAAVRVAYVDRNFGECTRLVSTEMADDWDITMASLQIE